MQYSCACIFIFLKKRRIQGCSSSSLLVELKPTTVFTQFPSFLFPSPSSEELFPCEQQRALQSQPLLLAGQRLVQQAAVDHLPAPGHRPVKGQDRSHQPVAALTLPWPRAVSHSGSQPQLGHGHGRPHLSLTRGQFTRLPFWRAERAFLESERNQMDYFMNSFN